MSIEIIIPAYREADNLKKIIIKINQNIKDALITIIDDTPDQDMSKILKNFSLQITYMNTHSIKDLFLSWFSKRVIWKLLKENISKLMINL